jgi:hypothetical protein
MYIVTIVCSQFNHLFTDGTPSLQILYTVQYVFKRKFGKRKLGQLNNYEDFRVAHKRWCSSTG